MYHFLDRFSTSKAPLRLKLLGVNAASAYLRLRRQALVRTRFDTLIRIRCPSDDGYVRLWLQRAWETGTSVLCVQVLRLGDTVFDCGANIRYFTTLFARLVGPLGRVDAFEPLPEIFRLLCENCALNGFGPPLVRLNNFGVGDKTKEMPFRIPTMHAESSLLLRENLSEKTIVLSKTTTLDDYVASRPECVPALIKADIEGAEMLMLNGAKQLVARTRPMLILELNRDAARTLGWSTRDLIVSLKERGYSFVVCSKDGWAPPRPSSMLGLALNRENIFAYLPEHYDRVRPLLRS